MYEYLAEAMAGFKRSCSVDDACARRRANVELQICCNEHRNLGSFPTTLDQQTDMHPMSVRIR